MIIIYIWKRFQSDLKKQNTVRKRFHNLKYFTNKVNRILINKVNYFRAFTR